MNANLIVVMIPFLLILSSVLIGNYNKRKVKNCKHRYRWWYSNTDTNSAKQVCIYCDKVKK